MPRTKQPARKSAGSYQTSDATAATDGNDYGMVGYLPESMVFTQSYDKPEQLKPLEDIERVAREARNGRENGSGDEVEEVSSTEFHGDKQTARKSALSFQTRERLGVPGERLGAPREWARPPRGNNGRRPGRPVQTARKTAPLFQSIEEQDSESEDTDEDEEEWTPELREQRRRMRLRRMPLMPVHAARKSAPPEYHDSSLDSTTVTSDDDGGTPGTDKSLRSPTPTLS